jgi:hypothetical protein
MTKHTPEEIKIRMESVSRLAIELTDELQIMGKLDEAHQVIVTLESWLSAGVHTIRTWRMVNDIKGGLGSFFKLFGKGDKK